MKDSHTMNAGDVLAGIALRPCSLRVVAGRVWITREGDLDDHWLIAGQRLPIQPDQLIVVEADSSASQVEIACVNNRGVLIAILRCFGTALRQPFRAAVGGAA
ncbi:DUF2917 domain-containing protein [Glaciimonas sp. PAMC28666]|uniref:DUF2917 domain-containing protein n=1 Tax=Glaciimonas sp. PAMC28666 TaxID=2807626 RepID=UPI0019623758|nr:DUF2917 domain-containing protein [Glaciimonas sp. PAMC28666]QRX82112.1 DUF2917 domain-containing protein [Glaciimonas sp. PAMC28666]